MQKTKQLLQIKLACCLLLMVFTISCSNSNNSHSKQNHEASTNMVEFNLDEAVKKCETQLTQTVSKVTDLSKHPRLIEKGETHWEEVPNDKLIWTSGFYPGILWYMYDITKQEKWKTEAIKRTEVFEDFKSITEHHDIGFMMFPAYGNGYKIGKKSEYKDVLLTSANSLATRFNPNVGTIKSWSNKMHPRWQQHITIIDNMLNLELLFWAAKNGGDKKLYDIAVTHALTTMTNHFREDLTSWHVLEYDEVSGEVLNKHTKQGLHDNSRWSRGQAWGIYGYTMVYRETGDKRFLDFAKQITDKYLSMLPEDYIPYWDFDIDTSKDTDRDASAGAIVASALLELSTLLETKQEQQRYFNAALKMLNSLNSEYYSGYGKADAFLLHSTGAKSLGNEIDVALIYADYYYLEALCRLKQILEKKQEI